VLILKDIGFQISRLLRMSFGGCPGMVQLDRARGENLQPPMDTDSHGWRKMKLGGPDESRLRCCIEFTRYASTEVG